MVYSFKNKLAYAVICTAAFSGMYYAITHIPCSQSIDSLAQAKTEILKKLNDQENLVWDLIKTDTQTTQEECVQKHQQYKRKKSSAHTSNPRLKQKTIFFVQNIVREFGLNPDEIQIAPFKGKGSAAAANDHTIFIDEPEFEKYSPEACTFMLAHEMVHLTQRDSTFQDAVYVVTNTKRKIKSDTKKKALNSLRRFHETRADTLALLTGGKDYVKGAFEFLHTLQKLDGGDNPGITHPKTSDRIKNVQEICSMMDWEKPEMHV